MLVSTFWVAQTKHSCIKTILGGYRSFTALHSKFSLIKTSIVFLNGKDCKDFWIAGLLINQQVVIDFFF